MLRVLLWRVGAPDLQHQCGRETGQVQQSVEKLHCSSSGHQRGQQIHKVIHHRRAVPRQELEKQTDERRLVHPSRGVTCTEGVCVEFTTLRMILISPSGGFLSPSAGSGRSGSTAALGAAGSQGSVEGSAGARVPGTGC